MCVYLFLNESINKTWVSLSSFTKILICGNHIDISLSHISGATLIKNFLWKQHHSYWDNISFIISANCVKQLILHSFKKLFLKPYFHCFLNLSLNILKFSSTISNSPSLNHRICTYGFSTKNSIVLWTFWTRLAYRERMKYIYR